MSFYKIRNFAAQISLLMTNIDDKDYHNDDDNDYQMMINGEKLLNADDNDYHNDSDDKEKLNCPTTRITYLCYDDMPSKKHPVILIKIKN